VTVCIAAICDSTSVIVAADRMMSAGDIEFESSADNRDARSVSKIIPLTTSIVVMTARDAAFQTEAMHHVSSIVQKRVADEPTRWWNVKEVVDLYIQFYAQDRIRRVRETILSPFGLDEQSFIARQKEMSELFVRNVANQITACEMPNVSIIVAGVDDSGVHIYKLYGANAECADAVGFASIGIGARHANSQFMLAGHHRQSSFADTLLLTFVAKKRSEVAPGVGKMTDMFLIGPNKGSLTWLPPIIELDKLEAFFTKIQKEESTAFEHAKKDVDKYVKEILEKAAAQAQQAPPPQPPPAEPPK
jgi:hypothetical protein